MSKYCVGKSDYIDRKSCQNIRLQNENMRKPNLKIHRFHWSHMHKFKVLFIKTRRRHFKDWLLNYTLNRAWNSVHQRQWKACTYLKYNSLPIRAVYIVLFCCLFKFDPKSLPYLLSAILNCHVQFIVHILWTYFLDYFLTSKICIFCAFIGACSFLFLKFKVLKYILLAWLSSAANHNYSNGSN